ncbi:MAG: hypothetical protein ACTHK0_15110 [Ginsengibacter sp.]
MSLNSIQLSDLTCQMLFEKNLIAKAGNTQQQAASKEVNISSLGENQQNILFLVNESDHKFLPDDEMEMLSNLVIACKLSMTDIALVNYRYNQYQYNEFNDYFKPKIILLFGISTAEIDLPFTIPFFQIQQFQQQLFLTAPPLADFLENKNLKKDLWISLQKLFLNK